MTTTTVRKLLWTSLLGVTLGLGACGNQGADKTAAKDAKGDKKADKKAGDVKAGDKKAGDVKADDVKAGDVKEEAPVDEPLDERVVKAASLAKKIEADPSKADEVLAEAGMDRASFDALILEVSTPELAEQYRLARARET
jgi:hypothetical protein